MTVLPWDGLKRRQLLPLQKRHTVSVAVLPWYELKQVREVRQHQVVTLFQ